MDGDVGEAMHTNDSVCTCSRFCPSCIDIVVAAFIIWLGSCLECKASEVRRRQHLFLLELAHELLISHVWRRPLIQALQAPIRTTCTCMPKKLVVEVDLAQLQQAQEAVTVTKKSERYVAFVLVKVQ